jgi:hypothetical protein
MNIENNPGSFLLVNIDFTLPVVSMFEVWEPSRLTGCAMTFFREEVFGRLLREARVVNHPETREPEMVKRAARKIIANFGFAIRGIKVLPAARGNEVLSLQLQVRVLTPAMAAYAVPDLWFRETYLENLANFCTSWASMQHDGSPYALWLVRTYSQLAASFTRMLHGTGGFSSYRISDTETSEEPT